jgi:hypothetical protein
LNGQSLTLHGKYAILFVKDFPILGFHTDWDAHFPSKDSRKISNNFRVEA